MSDRPAWSDAFAPDTLGPAPSLGRPAAITPAWAFGDGTGAGIKVAIVDSGIDAAHPAVGGVAGGVVIEPDADAPGGTREREESHDDLYGHGTACAAIIRGLAPGAELYSVRVLGTRLTGRAQVFARGLEWCLERGMHVVNLSLSTTNDQYYARFHELCDRAAFERVLLVSALANEPKATYPSQFSTVFSVAATDVPVGGVDHVACNPAPPAEWGAAGIDVEVAWLEGGRITASGNSFAAPVVAGLLARILAAHPGMTPWQAKTVLAAIADNQPG